MTIGLVNNFIADVNIGEKFKPAEKFANETSLGPAIGDLYNIAVFFAFIIAFALIIWGGIKLITSGGDSKAVESGRKTITYAIAGLVLIIVAYFIVLIVQALTRVQVLQQ